MSQQDLNWKRRDILRTLATGAGVVGNVLLFGTSKPFPSPLVVTPFPDPPQTHIMPDTANRTLEIGTCSAPEVQFDQINSDELMKAARDAGVQCVMIYSMEHWGYALYDTKVGYKHPKFRYDYVGKQVEAARRYGISPLCYYSFNFANEIAVRHPDWRMLTRDGKPEKRYDRFYLVCQIHPMANSCWKRSPNYLRTTTLTAYSWIFSAPNRELIRLERTRRPSASANTVSRCGRKKRERLSLRVWTR